MKLKHDHIKDGYREVSLSSYRQFQDWVFDVNPGTPAPHTSLVYRGQRRDDWKLEPTLDRELRRLHKVKDPSIRKIHLRRFQYAMRGRRGPNPPRDLPDDELWALGRHYGLATPLLDWTASPFAAAYFAYCEENPSPTGRRCVFALCRTSVELTNEKLRKETAAGGLQRTLEFYRPLTNENPRLISQAGLFTHAPDGVSVEKWIMQHFKGVTMNVRLYKITLPETDRETALRSLNLMNINHLTLFPDAHGASEFCNLCLRIAHYAGTC
jgi:hypothetical protein